MMVSKTDMEPRNIFTIISYDEEESYVFLKLHNNEYVVLRAQPVLIMGKIFIKTG